MSSRRNFNAPRRHTRKPDFFSACGGFITETIHLARSDPSVAGGRCLIVGAGLGATGFAAVTLGAALESVAFPIIIIGALAAFGGKGKGPGLAILTAGVMAFVAAKVLQATGVAAMITGGITALLGVGLIVASQRKLFLSPPHQPQQEPQQAPQQAQLLPPLHDRNNSAYSYEPTPVKQDPHHQHHTKKETHHNENYNHTRRTESHDYRSLQDHPAAGEHPRTDLRPPRRRGRDPDRDRNRFRPERPVLVRSRED